MYPAQHAASSPDRLAVVMAGSGESRSYRELDDNSARLAGWLRDAGVGAGEVVLVCLENDVRWGEIVWSCLRSERWLAPVNWHLTASELVPLFEDAAPAAVVTSSALLPRAAEAARRAGRDPVWLVVGGPGAEADSAGLPAVADYDAALSAARPQDAADDVAGSRLLFSSGTTGRPKPFRQPLPGVRPADLPVRLGPLLSRLRFDVGAPESLVYLSTGPAYHAAPFAFLQTVHQLGGTVVLMERFDPRSALAAIERHRVSHSQWVPTMFVRLLRLPDAERREFDLSSHQVAVHAGAPCPPEVKRAMLDWWGPVLYEYYGASEGHGHTTIGPAEWLAHPGSVGTPVSGRIEIRAEDGTVLPAGETGRVWFVRETAEGTVGDLGHLDADGFLYLTGRVGHTIITGGVNVYPREVEDVLALHPAVADLAVLGVPDPEFGEQVKAVVEPRDPASAGPGLERELIEYCRARLAHFKCPRSVDFTERLPRNDAGKVVVAALRDKYWPAAGASERTTR